MKNQKARLLALLLAGMMGVSMLSGCGGSADGGESAAPAAEDKADSTADADGQEEPADETVEAEIEEFTWLIDMQPIASMYEEYEDNPIYKYWSDMVWDVDGVPNKIAIDFSAPPSGSEQDNVNTLIATQEYPDVMSTSYSSANANELYDQGIAIDLTEYVEKYMPNYRAWMEEHPAEAKLMTNKVDGEDRYIQIYGVSDQAPEMWGGFVYRRDWIVKYGKNPKTGEAFTGEWVETENGDDWVDDVVFPSGSEDPMTISDWEWMLDIFATALEEQGITDGYPMTLPYSGYYQVSDLVSGFGEGPLWYMDEKGTARFGGDSDAFRTYIECVRTWYENGWIDPAFDERASDMFFQIDTTSVYGGKVGMWYGMSSQMGSVMDVSDGDESNPTNGIVVFGAPQPVNDVYGTKDQQGMDPFCFFGNSLVSGSVIVTEKAKDKDIATLLTAVDYLYSQEGGLLRSIGFSDEQQAELQNEFYAEHHLDNGVYHIEQNEDGEDLYFIHNERDNEDDLAQSAMMERVVGLKIAKNIETGYPSFKQRSVDLWVLYSDYGQISGTVTGQLSADQAQETAGIQSAINTFTSQAVADFVAGRRDITSDKDWDSYVSELNSYDPQTYCDYINEALGN